MEIKQAINSKDYEVGVIVGRFQTDELHEGHISFIDEVFENHKKVIILIGIARITGTKKNPLDYAAREAMVKQAYPKAVVLPIRDERYDDKWSRSLDTLVTQPYGEKKIVLYGSRDSFIPYYSGKYPVIELENSGDYNATNIRAQVARETLSSRDFRRGVIYQAFNYYPVAYPTVDVCVYDNDGKILLGRKPNESYFRFIGGFVDPSDASLEAAAKRELSEEASINLVTGTPKYMLSQKIDDWRYRNEESGIMTSLFLAQRLMGFAEADDDIAEVKWIDFRHFSNFDGVRTTIIPEHRELMLKLVDKVYAENLIPNIGERKAELENVSYTAE
jgi:bifunctional NMN adenylyltransferase/nudix hydrolase